MTLRPIAPPLALLVAATALGPASLHIIVPSLPALANTFDTDFATAQLTLTAYLVAIALAQLVYGPLSDRYGRRPVLLSGLLTYLLGTAACGIAPSIEVLVAGRLVQGFGGCAGMVIGRAIVRDVHERDKSASVIALITMAMALAPAFAPAVGGYIEVLIGWRADFLLLGAVGATIFGFSWLYLSETKRDRIAVPLRALLVQHGQLLRSRVFLGYSFATACSMSSWFAFTAGAPYILVKLLGLEPTVYGQLILIVMAGYIAGNFAAARLSERLGVDRMMFAGIAVSLLAMAFLIGWNWFILSPLALFVPMALSTLGNGVSQPNGIAAALSVKPAIAGTASGLMGFVQMTMSGAATLVVGYVQNSTSLPMIAVIAGTTVLGLFAAMLTRVRPPAERC